MPAPGEGEKRKYLWHYEPGFLPLFLGNGLGPEDPPPRADAPLLGRPIPAFDWGSLYKLCLLLEQQGQTLREFVDEFFDGKAARKRRG